MYTVIVSAGKVCRLSKSKRRQYGHNSATTVEPTTAPTAPTNGTVSHGTKPKNDSKSLFEFNGFTIAMMSLGIVALALIAISQEELSLSKRENKDLKQEETINGQSAFIKNLKISRKFRIF